MGYLKDQVVENKGQKHLLMNKMSHSKLTQNCRHILVFLVWTHVSTKLACRHKLPLWMHLRSSAQAATKENFSDCDFMLHTAYSDEKEKGEVWHGTLHVYTPVLYLGRYLSSTEWGMLPRKVAKFSFSNSRRRSMSGSGPNGSARCVSALCTFRKVDQNGWLWARCRRHSQSGVGVVVAFSFSFMSKVLPVANSVLMVPKWNQSTTCAGALSDANFREMDWSEWKCKWVAIWRQWCKCAAMVSRLHHSRWIIPRRLRTVLLSDA